MKVIYNQDQLERLAILGAKLSVSADGITRLDLEGVKMQDIKKVYRIRPALPNYLRIDILFRTPRYDKLS